MPFRIRGVAYQSPQTAKKRWFQSCYSRQQHRFPERKKAKHRFLQKTIQIGSRLVLPSIFHGIKLDFLMKLRITITTLDDYEEPPDLSLD